MASLGKSEWPPGHLPVVSTQQNYECGFVYRAVRVELNRTAFLLTEAIDQPHSLQFYRQISARDPVAMQVLIQDGAGFHLTDGYPTLPDNVRLLPLPADSPELNPIEGLRDQIKEIFCNQMFANLAELERMLITKLQRFWQDARCVRSLVFDWLLAQANISSTTIIPIK